ncbi:MAG: YbjN domain-containing protein [Bacteroidales bacterium]|nr:YbjN domain-containing protein [Bacteroidales bacterium]
MINIQYYYDMFENVVRNLGVDPVSCRGKQEGQWDLQKGSAPVWVDIYTVENGQYGYIQIISPLFEVPDAHQTNAFSEALEINHTLVGCSITKFNNWLYIKSIRELDNLSESEINNMINRVGIYADRYDDHFKSKYGN